MVAAGESRGSAKLVKNFFISYTSADRVWAEWITWQLEAAGYSTMYQAWDFRPGASFVEAMDRAAREAERTVAVLSPAYLAARYTLAEWGAAFARDPTGELGLLVPVRVAQMEPGGLLRQFVYVDLVGRDEVDAREALLEGVQRRRAKPSVAPRFPGAATQFPGNPSVVDEPIAAQDQRITLGLEQERREMIRRGEEWAFASPHRIAGLRPGVPVDAFKNREEQQKEIGRLLTETSTRLVSVIGRAGIGKTALVTKILSDLEHNRWPHTSDSIPVDGILYLSTTTSGINLERLFQDCALMLGGEQSQGLIKAWQGQHLTTPEKVDRLLSSLANGLYVILLDNMEDLLDAQRQIVDEDLRTFFTRSLVGQHSAKLLVTSRIPLALPREMMRLDRRVPLEDGVPVPEGIAILRESDPNNDCGLRDASLELLAQAVERLHGVPLALEILVSILKDDHSERLEDVLERYYEHPDVVNDLIQEGYKRLDPPARRVVQALAVFARPVKSAAVDFLLRPFTPGLDVPNIIQRLASANVVKVDRSTGTIQVHPIERDCAYYDLPQEGVYSRQALERRAVDWWRSLRRPREHWKSIADVEPQLLEFEHLVRAGDYESAVEVLYGVDASFLVTRGYARRAQEMVYAVTQHLESKRAHLLQHYILGRTYSYIGPLNTAVSSLISTRALAAELSEQAIEADVLYWLGSTCRLSGLLTDSINYLGDAVSIFSKLNDTVRTFLCLFQLGLSYAYAGDITNAEKQAELLDQHAVTTHQKGTMRDLRALVALVKGQFTEALTQALKGENSYKEENRQDEVSYMLNAQGLALFGLNRLQEAAACLERSRNLARKVDNVRVEGLSLFNLAYLQYRCRELTRARKTASDALRILSKMDAAETASARALTEAVRSAMAGDTSAEVHALLTCAETSRNLPDLHQPWLVIEGAVRIAESAGSAELLALAQSAHDNGPRSQVSQDLD